MEAKLDGELTAKQAEAARFYALEGCTQSEAYRRAYNVRRAKPETVWNEASKLFRNPQVATRVRELLAAARMEQIISHGEHLKGMIERRDAAQQAGNLTAASSWDKTISQCLGMTREHVVLSAEKSLTDEELIASLAQGDEHRAKMLRAVLGKDGFA